MRTVRVETETPYDVLVGHGLLSDCGGRIAAATGARRAAVVSDRRVSALYCGAVAASLEASGVAAERFAFTPGEGGKSVATLSRLLEWLAERRFTRSDLVVALGGGVTGDLAGFAAAVYLRGVRYVQLPTTLLSAVDSSVGGKTAINLRAGKNLAGAFWQPSLVLCDCDILASLPDEILSDGLAECVKYGAIADRGLFELFASRNFRARMEETVARCVQIKAGIVARDERDDGERQLLNFGHTVGHAVELASGMAISHGRAVAIGMTVATRAAERLGLTEEPCLAPLVGALEANGLPVDCPFDAPRLAQAALGDKKRRGDVVTLVVPKKIGRCAPHPIAVGELERFIALGLGEGDS